MPNIRTSPNKVKVLMLDFRMEVVNLCSRLVGIPLNQHREHTPHGRSHCMITVFSKPLMEKFLVPVTTRKFSGMSYL
jgi:hypothetical protein